MPSSISSVVVLPAPLGPSRPKHWPAHLEAQAVDGMPTLAFGCAFGDWVGESPPNSRVSARTGLAGDSLALDNGYRAFDGARAYGTERIVGTLPIGHRQRFASGELTREELFITTKLAHPAAPPHINISHRRTWDADKVETSRRRCATTWSTPSTTSASATSTCC
jgi:aryl-alcohol dehydrogenase-like predicted oxidoreductase